MHRKILPIVVIGVALTLSACASRNAPQSSSSPAPAAPASSAPAPASNPNVQKVKSADGTFEGEVVGKIAPTSRFAKVKIGMSMADVTALIKEPNDTVRHETGKRWIPWYFGNDAQRVQAYYAGDGCLTYAAGNAFGRGGNNLIRITVDATRKCMDE